MRLGKASFHNSTGRQVQIFLKDPGTFSGTTADLPAGATTAALEGTLLTMDVVGGAARLSYDFSAYLPNGLWVEDESPYDLLLALGSDSKTMELVVRDNTGDEVGSFAPAG